MNASIHDIRAHLTRIHEVLCVEYMLHDGEMAELLEEQRNLFQRQHDYALVKKTKDTLPTRRQVGMGG